MSKLMVRLISPWTKEMDTESAFFSSEIPEADADALLCEWAPSDELFSFPRRKAWYCCETHCQFQAIDGGTWPRIKKRLAPHEFLCHNHSDPRYRVPEMTHLGSLGVNTNKDRRDKAIAIVSNFGGSPWRRHREIAYRNRFITHPSVDLYGRESWRKYRRHWYSRPRSPANYCGPVPGDWEAAEKRALLAKYRVAVCLPNMCEPYGFCEKFVEAACAGCIPIYSAHPTLNDTVLSGARWIDPRLARGDVQKTVATALGADLGVFQEANATWLKRNPFLAHTHPVAVYTRIGWILAASDL